VYKWTTANHITINLQKSHWLIISPKKTNPIRNLATHLNNSLLAINESKKYLGIMIDCRLNFKNQIKLLTAEMSRSLGVIYKLWHTLPATALRNLYYSMIHPHLLYEIVIWGNAYEKLIKTLKFYKIKLSNY